jgi:ribonuclease HII
MTSSAAHSLDLTDRTSCERSLWLSGAELIAGVDEVGRGALAGPLVAAAVIFRRTLIDGSQVLPPDLAEIDDSKLIRPARRRELATAICNAATAVGIGVVEVEEIDAFGMGIANRIALERAVLSLPIEPDGLVIDAAITDLGTPQIGMIDGDACSISVAAASIVAKVSRDRFMEECDGADPRYGFRMHKGYGSALHLEALRRFGPCWLHRRSFSPVALLIPPSQS